MAGAAGGDVAAAAQAPGRRGGAWGYPSGGYGGYGYGYNSLGSGYYGPSNWLYGGSLYDLGYSTYSNPYYVVSGSASPAVDQVVYDYSQPLSVVSAPPAETSVDQATTLFNSARESFKAGDFGQALQQADAALVQSPNDSSLHEFRALCLFALGRYDDAATPLYAVLSVGPGWDWPTLVGMYPNVSVYTSQLRALEDYCRANPQAAGARFVQAYHYATEGYLAQAANVLRQVIVLKPTDTLSAKLLDQIQAATQRPASAPAGAVIGAPAGAPIDTPTGAAIGAPAGAPIDATAGAPIGAPAGAPVNPVQVVVNTAVPEGATLTGTWTTEASADPRVSLTVQPDGAFRWQVTQKGQTREFTGTSNFGGGILTLVPDNTPPIVGRVSWTDPSHITFRVVGDRPDAPGLALAKSVVGP